MQASGLPLSISYIDEGEHTRLHYLFEGGEGEEGLSVFYRCLLHFSRTFAASLVQKYRDEYTDNQRKSAPQRTYSANAQNHSRGS